MFSSSTRFTSTSLRRLLVISTSSIHTPAPIAISKPFLLPRSTFIPQPRFFSSKMTCHAVQIPKHGDSSVLAYVEVPKPTPKPDQVLIKVHYAGINFIDTYQRSGLYPQPMPFILGREGSGEIVQVGAEAEGGFKVGDRVAFIGPSSYADYTAVSTLTVAKLPDNISYEKVTYQRDVSFFVRDD